MVDVQTEIVIKRAWEYVAEFAGNPDNAPAWYVNILSVEWKSNKEVAEGAEIAFVAKFLGRRLAYTYKIREYIKGQKLVMSTEEGPFPMETTYLWEDLTDGTTRMKLRNRGKPAGFSKLFTPFMKFAMRRANNKDLRELKDILESGKA